MILHKSFWTLIHAENADFLSFESANSAFFSVPILKERGINQIT